MPYAAQASRWTTCDRKCNLLYLLCTDQLHLNLFFFPLQDCTNNSSVSRSNVLLLWEALIKSPVIAEHNLEKRLNAISCFLAQQHVFLTYPVHDLLKVLLSIVETSKVSISLHRITPFTSQTRRNMREEWYDTRGDKRVCLVVRHLSFVH